MSSSQLLVHLLAHREVLARVLLVLLLLPGGLGTANDTECEDQRQQEDADSVDA